MAIPNTKLGGSKKMPKMREKLEELCIKYNIPFETSFGGSYSKIDTFPKMNEEKTKLKIRIYVGYENDTDRIVSLVKEINNNTN